MKKIFSILVGATLATSAFAQKSVAFEVQAGANSSNISASGGGISKSADAKLGFNLGVRATFGIPSVANGLYANAGALLSLKGAKASEDKSGAVYGVSYTSNTQQTANAYYLEIPVHLGYKLALNDNVALFGEAGPYFAYGLFGKTTSETTTSILGKNTTETTSDDTFNDGVNKFDAGLGLRLGVEFAQKYNLSLGYDFGLTNLAKNAEGDFNQKNSNLSLSFGYKF